MFLALDYIQGDSGLGEFQKLDVEGKTGFEVAETSSREAD